MAELEKAKTVVFLNHSKNPLRTKNHKGIVQIVQIGESVEVLATEAKKLHIIRGMVDAAKYVKPTEELSELRKENLALKAKVAEIEAKLKK